MKGLITIVGIALAVLALAANPALADHRGGQRAGAADNSTATGCASQACTDGGGQPAITDTPDQPETNGEMARQLVGRVIALDARDGGVTVITQRGPITLHTSLEQLQQLSIGDVVALQPADEPGRSGQALPGRTTY